MTRAASSNVAVHHRFQWVLVSDLEMTCAQWGRPIRPQDARSIAASFDPDKLGVIAVWHRPELTVGRGRFIIIDGQHRVAAVRLIGWDDQRVPCLLYEHLTIETAAELSLGLQERRNLHALDKHRAAAAAHDRGAVEIDKVLGYLHLELCYTVKRESRRQLSAIGTLAKVWERMGSVGLERVLRICGNAWEGTSAGFSAKIIKLCMFLLAAHLDDVDDERLAVVLAKRSPAQWVSANVTPQRPLSSIAQDVILEYNKVARGSKRLDELTPAEYERAAKRAQSATVRGPINAPTVGASMRSRKRGVRRD